MTLLVPLRRNVVDMNVSRTGQTTFQKKEKVAPRGRCQRVGLSSVRIARTDIHLSRRLVSLEGGTES